MKNWCLTTFIVLLLFVTITSCKKDNNDNNQPITPTEVNESIDENGYTILEMSLSNGKMYFRLLTDNEAEVVGRSAFYDEEHIENGYLYKGDVSIPSSFSYSTRSTYVVTSIDEFAFANCVDLISIDFPNTIVTIGKKAFLNCVNLATVSSHPNLPPRCDASTFNGCTSLQTILVPDDNIAQYQSANGWIYYKNLIQGINGGSGGSNYQEPVIISTQEIANQGNVIVEAEFEDGSKMYFRILSPTTASVVNKSSFYIDGNESQGWTYRGDITIPSVINHLGTSYTITGISANAFHSCNLVTSIIMPNTITTIGFQAFMGCSNMTSIVLSNSLSMIDAYGFCGCSALEGISLPNNLLIIPSNSFNGCSSFTELILPASLQEIGSSAFSGCIGLTEVDLPESLIHIRPYAFSGAHFESITIPRQVETIGADAIEADYILFDAENCSEAGPFTKVKEIMFSENVSEVPSNICCNNSILENVVLSNSITIIGDAAFMGCTSLNSIEIPNSVEIIGTVSSNSSVKGAFQNCTSLTNISFGNNLKQLGMHSFDGCTGLLSIVFNNSNAIIGARSFYGCNNLTNVDLGDSIEWIDYGSFYDCSSLSSITIPNSTYYLGDYAFNGCTNLSSVVLGESVNCISDFTFRNCSSLNSIVIPNSAMSIGWGAFYGCTSLTTISMNDNANSIGGEAFYGCTNLESVVTGQSVQHIYDNAFSNCNRLSSIVIGQSVQSIARNAFNNCNSLSTVTSLPNTPPNIEGEVTPYNTYLFPNCPLQSIFVPIASVEEYKNATGWRWYADLIVGF